jgi:PAS domain S-box-containing protein
MDRAFQLLLGTMGDCQTLVAFKDREGRFLDVNAAVEKTLGTTRDRILGRTNYDFMSADAADVLRQHDDVVLRSRAAIPWEGAMPLPSGARFHVGTSFALVDDEGRADGTGHLWHDVTALRRSETELRSANERLMEADRRKNEFLGVLSHELRNPLAPIRNSILLLEEAPPGSAQAALARKVIRRQTDHLVRLVDDLLDVTRISRGKVELRREVMDLSALVRRTCEDHRVLFDANCIELKVDCPAEPSWADVDATRIAQVLGNMLHNANKFTPARGTVAVTLRVRAGNARVSVRDSGTGIEPEQVDRMFEPFAQEERNLERTRGGLGLGLALAKRLVELHGGQIHARSEGPGKGTEFTLTIPLVVDAGLRLCRESAARPLRS